MTEQDGARRVASHPPGRVGRSHASSPGPPVGVVAHDMSICESDSVGAGTRLWAFTHVAAGAVVGTDCNLGDGVYVEQGAVVGNRVTIKNGVSVWDRVTLEDDVFVGPGVAFTNDLRPRAFVKLPREAFRPTRVCVRATLGANSTIVCGVTIGSEAFVAAGSCVTRDVPANGLVAGNPARIRGWVCTCASPLDSDYRCGSCGRTFVLQEDGLRPGP